MGNKDDTTIKIGLGVWVCFCILISLWVFTRFLKGKQQLFSNLHIVEDSLRKMQETFELEQRKKSMGYVENLDDVTACLNKHFPNEEQSQQDEAEEEEKQLLTTENEMVKLDKDESIEQTIEDKKTI